MDIPLQVTIVISATFLGISEALPKKPYYWTTRKLECESIAGHRVSRCALHNPESKTELNPLCYEEIDEVKNETKIYCRIMCEESDDTTVLAKVPTWNHACNVYYNYMLERFREDWYLWRSGDCLNTTITFEVRCGFARDSRVFYRQNQKLFEYDDTEDEQKRARNWRIAFA
ncbi:Uncharacterized protein BM_BM2387 [Brugia malayi]|uniref:Bm2387 n=3 Tax=Brugia TaxID=6278 RepID=A0A0K0J5Q4_BRUMA|nr:Uncharacterized protein BM_BM2387 [Brugia malayi]CRZ25777.1 Bm2387 [Brugia malayi]VDN90106.1 unnamed protein product [Brugia pahangi]VDO36698.1 unnamed protein product [Brugia timori]VIO86340.1 Uncharacterized protein BM_BM2387 [Brugia malayi]